MPNTLIVEDDEAYAEILCALLQLRGRVPLVARTMAEAIEIIREAAIDVTLLDLRLPDSDTETSLNRIPLLRELGTRIIIIITGAPITSELSSMAVKAGADAVLSKDRDIPERLYTLLDAPVSR